ncbi:hypothetical protein K488DRAFT_78670 [Vararia minispora EC-137]|uniref:Uncharacterized protein n=1 Tax=Vararia minispora EC-137 TaxID=1314806 RepID=A0ACB8QKH1_9AGAM|nr:hypothetical protein K488DRAFT_78670 [Vararia minispora EC-137]
MLKLLIALVALATASAAAPLTGNAEIDAWLATTNATMTYIGSTTFNPLNTQVIYCNRRANNVCGGACSYYNGGATCLDAPSTQCLWASNNVAFCDRGGCTHSCNQFSSCGTRLDGGFCYTPGTRSILVGTA